MKNSVLGFTALALLAVGFAAGMQWGKTSSPDPTATGAKTQNKAVIPFDYQTPTPAISIQEAGDHRSSHYEALTSVGDVLELPGDFSQTEALFTIAGRAEAPELEEMILQAVRVIDRYDRQAALDILFSRYTELDPHAAVAYLRDIDLDIDDQILRSIFINWSKMDLPAAIAAVNEIEHAGQRRKAGYAVLTAASRHNYGDLDVIASQLVDAHNTAPLKSSSIGLRANYDPEAALYEALSLTAEAGRYNALGRVGIVWARNDPEAAVAAAESIPHSGIREQYLRSVYHQWVADDPESAVLSVLAIADPQARAQKLQSVLRSYAQVEPAAAVQLAAQLSGQAREQAYADVFDVWARHDPTAALQALETLQDGALQKANLVGSVANRLASRSPEQALAWVDTLEPAMRDAALGNILSQISMHDPQLAIDAALSTRSAGKRQQQVGMVMQMIAHQNPQLALQYIHELPEGQVREHTYQNIAARWASEDAPAALAWASTLTGGAQVQAIAGMALQIAGEDPQQAAAMVRQLPAAERGRVLGNVASRVGRRGSVEALAWLGQFSNEPAYGEAVTSVMHSVAQQDPQYALRFANSLADEFRLQATQIALNAWTDSDPIAAARWAAGSDAAVRVHAIGTVVSTWQQSDPAAALRWARGLGGGESRDGVLAMLATNRVFTTAEATGIVGDIESGPVRQQAIASLYFLLRNEQQDPQAAANFLNRVGASTELRQRLNSYHRD